MTKNSHFWSKMTVFGFGQNGPKPKKIKNDQKWSFLTFLF